jgi:RNA polymerase sigma-70 factor (ECF subfamily)
MHAMAEPKPAQAASPLADPDAFGDLFERHASDIYGFCFRRTGDGRASEDLAQAVFLEAWRRRNEVELAPEEVRPWLFGVALNLVRNQKRSLRRHRAALARLPRPRSDADLGEELAQRLDDERRAREVLDHLRGLSRGEQDVIAMCAWAELSYEQAATVLGVPVGTVRSRLARARAKLKEADR